MESTTVSVTASTLAMGTSDASADASLEGTTLTKMPVQGRNVSGRSWKTKIQKRASSLIKTKFNNRSTSWETKVMERNERQLAREAEKEMKAKRKEDIEIKKQRRLENEKRRAENEYNNVKKAAQALNPNRLGNTLKAMSKKQLRQVKKTRLNAKTGVVEYVPMFSKKK